MLWLDSDLFFLSDMLRRGVTVGEVAGFLGRTAAEVRAKAEKMHMPFTSPRRTRSRHP
jgi:hypothetical protein